MDIPYEYNVVEESGPDCHVFQCMASLRVRGGYDKDVRLKPHGQVNGHHRHALDFFLQFPFFQIREHVPGLSP